LVSAQTGCIEASCIEARCIEARCAVLGSAGDRTPSTAMDSASKADPATPSVRAKAHLIPGLRCSKAARETGAADD